MKSLGVEDRLCNYDPRNPMFEDLASCYDAKDLVPRARENCSCDNCVYGRDALAVEILDLREQLSKLVVGQSTYEPVTSDSTCYTTTAHGFNVCGEISGDSNGDTSELTPADVHMILDSIHTNIVYTKHETLLDLVQLWKSDLDRMYRITY